MNRNTESHYTTLPSVHMRRSKFDLSHGYKTTANFGELVPFFIEEVLPGDTFNIGLSSVCRMTTPLYPVMDSSFIDYYYFFVPNRLVWSHWNEFMGENTTSKWTPDTQYTIPTVKAPTGGWKEDTVADRIGLPTNVGGIEVSALPFRAISLIYNEWFRDQNVGMPLQVLKDDANIVGANLEFDPHTGLNADAVLKGGYCPRINKIHDYFTSCIPEPQKGEQVIMPLSGQFPVFPTNTMNSARLAAELGPVGMRMFEVNGLEYDADGNIDNSNMTKNALYNAAGTVQTAANKGVVVGKETTETINTTFALAPGNLKAVFDSDGLSTTINDLRDAFAVQGLLETFARAGSRYTEILRSCFGVVSEDSRLQRPEYLGGKRVPLNITQVLQTSSTDSTSPLGQTGAFSVTTDSDHLVSRSFTEHGYIIGFFAARHNLTYQQSLNKMWTRKDRFDFYWPAFANLGEQAVKVSELFCTGKSSDNNVFGYQERWAEYRYHPSIVTGKFRSNAQGTLDAWHYADYYVAPIYMGTASTGVSVAKGDYVYNYSDDKFYECLVAGTYQYSDLTNTTKFAQTVGPNVPITRGEKSGVFYSADWLVQGDRNVQRTLAVDNEPQLIMDVWFSETATRCMPVYSVPALLGHF